MLLAALLAALATRRPEAVLLKGFADGAGDLLRASLSGRLSLYEAQVRQGLQEGPEGFGGASTGDQQPEHAILTSGGPATASP